MNFNQIILGNSDLWNRVNIAFEWLGKQYDEENDENKMIYSIFALECLLNSNTENFSSITAAVAKDLREKNPPKKKAGNPFGCLYFTKVSTCSLVTKFSTEKAVNCS